MTTALPSRAPDDLLVPAERADLLDHLDHLEQRFSSLQDELRRAQKLASIGTMAAMLAHEFNNLLTPVIGYGQHALERNDSALTAKTAQKAVAMAQTIQSMCRSLLGLAAEADQAPRPVELAEMVREAIACLGRDLAKDNIQLTVQVPPDATALISPNQLLQVLYNLVLNARQAMLGRPGRLTISAAPGEAQSWLLRVGDTGTGIRPEDLPRIFEPFFTTKSHADRPDRGGIGLGLAVCRQIVEDAGGLIEVDSTPGQGTTFTLTLPSA